ncbi:hypothetical protein V1522DRAFT_415708 [Lipomyces starkeyi]
MWRLGEMMAMPTLIYSVFPCSFCLFLSPHSFRHVKMIFLTIILLCELAHAAAQTAAASQSFPIPSILTPHVPTSTHLC